MKENIKFYYCEICGNVIEVVDGDISHIRCCGKEMKELIANTVEASLEKHIPIVEKVEDELLVKVGAVEHPMEKEHYIKWIAIVSQDKFFKVQLFPEQDALARLPYIKDAEVYAFCNKHGLWKIKI